MKEKKKSKEQKILDFIEATINSMIKGPFWTNRKIKRSMSSFKKGTYILSDADRSRLEEQREFEDERKRRRAARKFN